MKKILCILMALFLMASFSGCLKDDYEALETEIEDLEDDVDDAKDDMDKLISKLQELTETKLVLEG